MSASSPKLHSIALRGFRSLASEQIVLDNPTFLVGRNGAGKSNLADALSFIAEAMAAPLLTVFDRRGGYRSVVYRDAPKAETPKLVTGDEALPLINGNVRGASYAMPDNSSGAYRTKPHKGSIIDAIYKQLAKGPQQGEVVAQATKNTPRGPKATTKVFGISAAAGTLRWLVKERRLHVVAPDEAHSQRRQEGLGIAVELRNISVMEKLQATYEFALQPHGDDGFKVQREVCRVTQEDGSVRGFKRSETGFESNPAVDIRDPVEERSEMVLKPAVEHDALALPLVAGHYPFREVHDVLSAMRVYKIDPLALHSPQSPDEGRRLLANGSNAASVLKHLGRHFPEELPNIRDLLAAIVPSMNDVQPTMYGNKLCLEFTQRLKSDDVAFDAADMSDGTLRALGLITAVFQRPTPPIVVIEEPELTMHPGALGAILDLLQHASERMQVVVTTHSPDILDARWIEERHLRLLEWEDGKTKVSRISDASRAILAEGVMCAGELLRSNALRAADPS